MKLHQLVQQFFERRRVDREIKEVRDNLVLLTNAIGIEDDIKAQLILNMLKKLKELELQKSNSSNCN